MAEKSQYGYPSPDSHNVTVNEVMKEAFFVSDEEWESIKSKGDFDYVVIGSSYCALGFIDRISKNNPNAKILVLERGPYFSSDHFQNLRLPPTHISSLHDLAERFPWNITTKTREGKYIKWQHGLNFCFGGRSIFWSGWCPEPIKEEMEGWPPSVKETISTYYPEAKKLMGIKSADKIFDKGCSVGHQPPIGTLQLSLQDMLANMKIPYVTRVIPAPLAVGSEQYR